MESRAGWWHLQKETYLSISGRYTSTLLMGTLTQLDLAGVYGWFCTATIVATFLAFRGLIRAVGTDEASRLHSNVAAVVAVVVFAGMLPSSVEAFFWMASAVTYQWGLVAYLAWLTLLVRIASDPDRARIASRGAAALLTVLLPGFNEILMPVVLVTIAGFVIASRRPRPDVTRVMLTLLGVAVFFTTVSLAAPGNVNRSLSYPDLPTRHNIAFALTETARQTIRFLAGYGSHAALWVAAGAAWWWGRPVLSRAVAGLGGTRRSVVWTLCLGGLVYATLLPLYWEYGEVNYTGEGRTYNVTYFVFCAAVVLGVAALLGGIAERWESRGIAFGVRRPAVDLLLAAALAVLMVASPVVLQAFEALRLAPAYLESQQARESVLRSSVNRGRAVLVNSVRIRPDGLFWGDIQPEESHWINTCVAAYYDLDSVRTP